jgi:hypothetical protein
LAGYYATPRLAFARFLLETAIALHEAPVTLGEKAASELKPIRALFPKSA